jgi:hypothetical protein
MIRFAKVLAGPVPESAYLAAGAGKPLNFGRTHDSGHRRPARG